MPRRYETPEPGQLWEHFKGGRYIIDHIGLDTETDSPQVAYYAQSQEDEYRRGGPSAVDWFHRRLDVFLGSAKTSAGANVWRFTRIEPTKEA